ncbi:MAG: hypothetical protein H5T42_00865 [Methanothrix sp.]|uniref:hypothetical protein n=1 Tax=Methanothrix TaxID=2222 RepID=UPI0015847EBD|nr:MULTISPECIES: hypothetical protein [Methanothrix]MBC7079022.1 hypothetical protein [Methanothrix sp.]NPU87178.1 hypothetical protein [Methanothrix sp.]
MPRAPNARVLASVGRHVTGSNRAQTPVFMPERYCEVRAAIARAVTIPDAL